MALAVEGDQAMVARVELLAAGQAPGAANYLAAVAADPKPGRAVPTVGAELDGARQQAGAQ